MKNKKQVNVRLDLDLEKRLRYLAIDKDLNFQDLIQELLFEGYVLHEFLRCREGDYSFPVDYSVIRESVKKDMELS